jgi:hypothetical protein
MFIEKFIKKYFISFYKDKEYLLLTETVKNKKVISSEKKEFKEKKELEEFIKEYLNQNPQTYVSTVIFTLNQGVIDSCDKKDYLLRDIDYDNVRIVCIDNKYSFYASIYDLNKIQKEYRFEIDFIYSVFAVIDYLAKKRKNTMYVLVFEKYLALLAYENNIPKYSDIIEIEEKEDEIEEIEEIDDIDLIDDSIEDIDSIENIEDIDDIEDIENIEEKLNNLTTGIEVNILNFIKESLKEYYENYSSDFIEKIVILDTIGIDIEITKLIEDEILIEAEYQKEDILKTINRLSIESL